MKKTSNINAKKLTQLGWQCFKDGQYREAIEYYDKALKLIPKNNTALENRARAAGKYGKKLLDEGDNFIEAKKYLTIALEIDQCNPWTNLNLGNYYQYNANPPDYGAADQHYTMVIDYAKNYLNFTLLDKAKKQFSLVPRHAIKYYMLYGRSDEAENYSNLVIERAGDDNISLTRLSNLHTEMGRYDEAISVLDTLSNKEDSEEFVRNIKKQKIFIYIQSDDYQKALKLSVELLEQDINDRVIWKDFAKILNALDQKENALKCIKASMTVSYEQNKEKYFEALSQKAVILKGMGQYELALEATREAQNEKEATRGHYKFISQLALLESIINRSVSEKHDQAIEKATSKAGAWGKKAGSALAVGEPELAIEYYEKAIELNTSDSESPHLLNGLAKCYMKQGEFRKAIDQYDKILQKTPTVLERCATLAHKAICLFMIEEYEAAEACCNESLEYDKNSKVYFYRGIIKVFCGKDEAFGDFDTAYKNSQNDSLKIGEGNVISIEKLLLRADAEILNQCELKEDEPIENIYWNKHVELFSVILNLRGFAVDNPEGFRGILKDLPIQITQMSIMFDNKKFAEIIGTIQSLEHTVLDGSEAYISIDVSNTEVFENECCDDYQVTLVGTDSCS